MSQLLNVVKPIAALIASASAGVVIKNVITHTTPENLSRLQAAGVFIGGLVLAGAAGDAGANYTVKTIEQVDNALNNIINLAHGVLPEEN